MDLIDRAKLESDLNKCEIVNYYDKDDDYVGYFVADTIYSCVRNASKVDAIPLSVIEEIKADIIEMRKRDPLYYYVSTEDILDWVLNTIDRKVKEYADGNNNRSRDAEI